MSKNVIDYLEELETAQGRNAKEDILRVAAKSDIGELLKKVFYMVDDPYVNFGVSKFKMPSAAVNGLFDDDTALTKFIALLEQLNDRVYTGNAAKKELDGVFYWMTARQQKWCERIIRRNLRVGVQGSTTEKVWPELVRKFNVALAGKLQVKFDKERGLQITSKLNYPVIVDTKLDGLRCIAVKHEGKVTLYTRNGKEIVTCQRVREAIEKAPIDNAVLDGEMLGSAEGDWNAANSVVMSSKNVKDDSETTYNVFDCMGFQDWTAQKNEMPYADRLSHLELVVGYINSKHVKQVEPHYVNSDEKLLELYSYFLSKGHEGLMVKDPTSPYVFDRSDAVMKLKPSMTWEGVIVGWYNGRKGTSREAGLGGFEVVFESGVVTRIGSGSMKADFQSEVMLDPESFIGKIVEVEGQPDIATKTGFTVDGRIRFPRLKRMRDKADVDPRILEVGRKYLESH